MVKFLSLKLPKFDLVSLGAALGLVTIGFSTIQSTILAGGESESLIKVQALAFVLGLAVFWFVNSIDFRVLSFLSLPFYLFTVVSLLLLFVFGENIRGSIRWFNLGNFLFQPSELAKPFLIVSFCAFFDYFKERINQWRILILLAVLAVLPLGLILKQPDFGTFIVAASSLGILFLASPLKWSRWLPVILITVILLPLFYLSLAPYQKARVQTFFNPQSDPLGSGYNVIQSKIAVGSGELWGRGWGRGTQSSLRFLPERHTDFIFATYAEETGFIGCLFLLLLYIVIFIRSLVVLTRSDNLLGSLLVLGSMGAIFSQVAINIGMNIGLLPVTGIPLPLVSYGGSQMVTTFFLLGIIASVAKGNGISYDSGS